jgi:Fic family protein
MNKNWLVIEQLHRDLLQFSTKDERHRGHYKGTKNHVGAFDEYSNQIAVIFETATPFDTPRLMTELVAWYNHEQVEKQFTRVLTTLLLLRAGYAYVPYSSLEPVVEQNKQSYYLSLRQTQGTIRTDAPA